ncbi:MAG: hypothetical protein JWN04_784, partial [Myxococcaceae bacterium]|nr:hypothetical protein [Myxococcaceae bacterium]
MIITLEANAPAQDIAAVVTLAERSPGIEPKIYTFPGQ